MEIVYILQIITICITALTFVVNVLITLITNKQKNYNEIITNNRIEFMLRNRDNATQFIAEARYLIFKLKNGECSIDLKPLYLSYEQICMALKPYNSIDNEIITAGKNVLELAEESVLKGHLNDSLLDAVNKFARLFNIYDDADWKFIKQQFNSTHKKSADFDKICEEIKIKYND